MRCLVNRCYLLRSLVIDIIAFILFNTTFLLLRHYWVLFLPNIEWLDFSSVVVALLPGLLRSILQVPKLPLVVHDPISFCSHVHRRVVLLKGLLTIYIEVLVNKVFRCFFIASIIFVLGLVELLLCPLFCSTRSWRSFAQSVAENGFRLHKLWTFFRVIRAIVIELFLWVSSAWTDLWLILLIRM